MNLRATNEKNLINSCQIKFLYKYTCLVNRITRKKENYIYKQTIRGQIVNIIIIFYCDLRYKKKSSEYKRYRTFSIITNKYIS